ncbi:transcription antitermination factor NusB, partial [Anaerotruncus massiliensis (ex Liu et al. 2021)]
MKDARTAAAQALMRMEGAGAYSNLVIDALSAKNGLSPRDGAFAAALFYGTLERMLTIDHILARYSAKPLSALTPAVRASLRMGVCQLLYMDGVDDYAAVSESVNLVKSLGCARASGFVNGVLRAFLRDGKAVPPAGGSRAGQLAVDYSCPAWLVKEWLASYGEEAALRMLAGSLGKAPVYLRANTLRITPEALCERLAAEGAEAVPAAPPGGCVAVRGRLAVETLSAFAEGL